jgi:GT2 family glycosyltransferase
MVLSIIIVSWNVRDYLADCIESVLENCRSLQYEIIVVDNASTDGTTDFIKNKYPRLVLIPNSTNKGFGYANNQGISQAQGRYLLFLNPDTIMKPNAVEKMLAFLEQNKDVGAIGPMLLNEDLTIQRSVRAFPTFRGALYRHTILRYFGLFKSHHKKWRMKNFKCDRLSDVDQLMGAAILTEKDLVLKVGGFDERFFMYYEEVDFCYRIKKAGYRIVFFPDASIIHLGGKSARQIPLRKKIMAIRSLLRFFAKHRNKPAVVSFTVFFLPLFILREILELPVRSVKAFSDLYTFLF